MVSDRGQVLLLPRRFWTNRTLPTGQRHFGLTFGRGLHRLEIPMRRLEKTLDIDRIERTSHAGVPNHQVRRG